MDYVWKELLTSESGVLERLKKSTNVKDATAAFTGFERPSGWSSAAPMGAHNWSGRLGGAEAALAKFGRTTTDVGNNLGTLGNGFDVFGNALSSAVTGFASGGAQGGLSGFLGALVPGIAGALGIPGFAVGGPTGGSDPSKVAGLVHEGEYVFDASATTRIGIHNLDAIRKGVLPGYAKGGAVTSMAQIAMPAAAQSSSSAQVVQLQPVLVNNSSTPMQMEVEETTDQRGQRQQKYILSDASATGLATRGGRAQRALRNDFGIRRPGISRP